MTDRNRWPDRVDHEDRPDATAENVPDDVLSVALSTATMYGACPDCGEEQFIPTAPGHNTRWNCRECDFGMKVIG